MHIANQWAQRKRFSTNKKGFVSVYGRLKELGSEPFVMPFWKDVNKKVAASFEPLPDWGFLDNRALRDTMFVAGDKNWLNTQVKFLEKTIGKSKLRDLSREDSLGKPVLLAEHHLKTSHNTIHHLYHIYFYLKSTKTKPSQLKTVVEWGGGYGNFAKLWRRAIDSSGTYIIIDTALFCSIQWLYLSSVLGNDQVHIIDSKTASIEKGKINLVPLALLDNVRVEGDLFVSTWGLSESLDAAQDYVVNNSWFSCDRLLIGFQDSTEELKHASRLGRIAKKSGAQVVDIDFIPNNHYALK